MSFLSRITALLDDARWSDGDTTDYAGDLLADCLDYRLYDAEARLYLNEASTGFLFEIPPQGFNNELPAAVHAALIAHAPAGATVQILNWTSPGIEGRLAAWAAPWEAHSHLLREAATARSAHLKKLRFGDASLARTIPHTRRVFVAAWLDGGYEPALRHRLDGFRDALKSAFGGAPQARDLTPEGLIALLSEILNRRAFDLIPSGQYDPSTPINFQLAGASLTVAPQGLTLHGAPELGAAIATIQRYPTDYSMDRSMCLWGPPDRPALRPHGPVLTSFTFRAMPSVEAGAMLTTAHAKMEHTNATGMARFVPDLGGKMAEFQALASEIDSGETLFQTIYSVTAFTAGGVKDARAALSDMATIYRAEGMDLQNDTHLQMPLFLASLPFGATKPLFKTLGRFQRMRLLKGRAAAELLPVYGEWTGGERDRGMLLTGRQGQIFTFDPFGGGARNNNVTVTGQSGSGKSVVMQEMVASTLAAGGQVIVIDDGYSFARLARVLGGTHVAFDGKRPPKLNPFSLIDPAAMEETEYRSDALELITRTIATMASLSTVQTTRVLNVEEDLIRDVVAEIWEAHGPASEIGHVRDRLAEQIGAEPRLADIVTKLGRFSPGGDLGAYFSGAPNPDMNDLSVSAPLTIFELSDIKGHAGLEEVVLQLIMFVASEAMFKSPRDQAVAIVIDEAWDLLQGEMTGKFIEGIVRRARKYRGGLITGTQSLADYDKTPATRVCLDNSPTWILMQQSADTLDAMVASGKLKVSPGLVHLLKSMTSIAGSFAEMAIRDGDNNFTFGRLLLDPYSLALYSSRAETVAAIEALEGRGLSTSEAIAQVAYSGEAI